MIVIQQISSPDKYSSSCHVPCLDCGFPDTPDHQYFHMRVQQRALNGLTAPTMTVFLCAERFRSPPCWCHLSYKVCAITLERATSLRE